MVVIKDGKAYFHQFNSKKGEWEFVLAPQKYQQLDDALRKFSNPDAPPAPEEIAPTQQVAIHRVIGNEIVPELAYWTLVPPWVNQPSETVATFAGGVRIKPPPRCHFNSRKDTLLKSRGWLNLLKRNRCVILIDSFFEWSDDELLAGRPKMVGRFGLTGGRMMPVAGIWSTTYTPAGAVQTCSVVTCEPNELLEGLPHHRMPAILQGDDLWSWLDPRTEHPENALHATASEEMEARIVSAKQMRDLVRLHGNAVMVGYQQPSQCGSRLKHQVR